uniref:hypothetical protein n=1 Tax=uncultured Dysgonomonas sp. TaxID=206096 RepID=UPI0026193392|nr:hypothetical protein [uncultured Dysgonomonas sp.]
MNIEVKTKGDYSIVQIGVNEDIRLDMQEKIKQLYNLQSPIKDFSLHYPFEIDQLEGWEDILDWQEVSSNLKVEWTDEVIRKFKDRWNWYNLLFTNHSIKCLDKDLLEEFSNKWNWLYHIEGILEHRSSMSSTDTKLSELFRSLYLYAKSIDEELGIFILYDAIEEYLESKIKE